MVHKSPADHLRFANILDPDQGRQNICPDLDPDCLRGANKWTLLIYHLQLVPLETI